VKVGLTMSSGRVAKKRMTLNIPERAKIVLAKNVNRYGGKVCSVSSDVALRKESHRDIELNRIQKM
jgi:hypothetical protein